VCVAFASRTRFHMVVCKNAKTLNALQEDHLPSKSDECERMAVRCLNDSRLPIPSETVDFFGTMFYGLRLVDPAESPSSQTERKTGEIVLVSTRWLSLRVIVIKR
jgi:hypothetical protein